MKKSLLSLVVLLILVGCGASNNNTETIKVGASITPHAEILEVIKDDLKEQGYTLEIVTFTDYVIPNVSLEDGSLDANFFQHEPYLLNFNEEHGTDLVSAGVIHYEPFGIYSKKYTDLSEVPEGAQVIVPNDGTNEARALLLLEAAGLITVDKEAGINATIRDITDNPKKLEIVEIEAAQLTKSLADVDLAVINGNYALQDGLDVKNDALVVEDEQSFGAVTYGNVIAVRAGDENSEKTKALLEALRSEKVTTFINETYKGSVVSLLP
ncbi:MAG: ABC transporter substrate-binding protein [Erysipelothrix sp.]|nr:ABC transporter substrate-binding protein [Erysipelothrix sp.]